MKIDDNLYLYDDVFSIIIKQHLLDIADNNIPYVILVDEKTLVNMIINKLHQNETYGIISNSKIYKTVPLMSKDKKKVIISQIIYCPLREWKDEESRDYFMLSMILRAYFQRNDTFNWSDEEVIKYFTGTKT